MTVTASNSSCSWSVTGVCSWINITSGNGGTGNGTVNYTVQANPGAARSCNMTIAGQTFTVNQSGGVCVSVSIPTNVMAPAGSVIKVPINTTSLSGQGVTAYDFVLNFNSSILTPASTAFDTAGTLSSGMTVTPNTSQAGRFIIWAFGTTALSGSGELIRLRFNVVGAPGASRECSLPARSMAASPSPAEDAATQYRL